MSRPASEVYEVVFERAAHTRKGLRWLFALFGRGTASSDDELTSMSGVIIRIVEIETGEEIFRHVESDDESHVLEGIEHELATFTASDFLHSWKTT